MMRPSSVPEMMRAAQACPLLGTRGIAAACGSLDCTGTGVAASVEFSALIASESSLVFTVCAGGFT